MKVLAGDIGGTKTLLAVVELEANGAPRVVREERFASREHSGLEEVLDLFGIAEEVDAACFAVAGPVVDGRCETTNLPWRLDRRALSANTGIEHLELINDFLVIGRGLEGLVDDQLLTLREGREVPHAPRAVLGAGTGLGEAFLLWQGEGYQVFPTEGGHADFAPRNELEIGLLRYLARQHGRVSVERVLSGPGLVEIYRFLVEEAGHDPAAGVMRQMAVQDPAAVITAHALASSDPTCVEALAAFTSIYGAEAGNLALRTLALGGVYVAGGIAPRIAGKLNDGTFCEAFLDKGRLRPFLEQVPVRVVLEPRVGLFGAASLAAALKPASTPSRNACRRREP